MIILIGVSFDEITRGDILSSINHFTSADQELIIDFKKVPFYKNDLSENHSYLLSIGTQIRPAKIEKLENNKLKILSEKLFSFKSKDTAILVNPDSKNTNSRFRKGKHMMSGYISSYPLSSN